MKYLMIILLALSCRPCNPTAYKAKNGKFYIYETVAEKSVPCEEVTATLYQRLCLREVLRDKEQQEYRKKYKGMVKQK